MKPSRTPSWLLLAAALFCCTAALVLLAADLALLAVIATGGSALAMIVEFVRISAPDGRRDSAFLARLTEHAEAGRRLAIYDRDTGLFAHWYIALRGQEECARAARYGRKLSLLVIEPRSDGERTEWAIKSEIGRWFQTELRETDVAGYLGNGRYVVLTPEADSMGVASLIERLREKVQQVDIGSSAFPEDGVAFQQLWRRATARLPEYGSQGGGARSA